MRLQIKVVPGSSREQLHWLGKLLKVNVRAAPENGKANSAVEQLLAAKLGLPGSAVKVVSGFGSPLKTVEISGMDADTLGATLDGLVK